MIDNHQTFTLFPLLPLVTSMQQMIPYSQLQIILFDGHCNLCNGSVQFVIKHDSAARFKFASLQSDTGKRLLAQYHLNSESLQSFVFIDKGKLYTRSTAALQVSRYLDGFWKLFSVFIIVPPFMRNGVYRLVANNRYRWFGKADACCLPTPDLAQRFVL